MAGHSYSIVYKLLNSRGEKVVARTIYSCLSRDPHSELCDESCNPQPRGDDDIIVSHFFLL